MTERRSERTDRIDLVTHTADGAVSTVTPIMEVLPRGLINYGARPEKAVTPEPSKVLPNALTRLDLRGIGANGHSEVIIGLRDEEDPRIVALDEEGVGRVEVGERQELVVYAAGAVEDARQNASRQRSRTRVHSGHSTSPIDGHPERDELRRVHDLVHRKPEPAPRPRRGRAAVTTLIQLVTRRRG